MFLSAACAVLYMILLVVNLARPLLQSKTHQFRLLRDVDNKNWRNDAKSVGLKTAVLETSTTDRLLRGDHPWMMVTTSLAGALRDVRSRPMR